MKLQNAIEYLTTYAWAIIVIAVVIAALFALRIFNPAPQTECVLPSGFSCENLYLSQNGMLLMNLFETGTSPINLTAVECNSNDTLTAGHLTVPYNPPSNQITLDEDQNYTFTNIQCYYNGATYNSMPGQVFRGSIIINYTDDSTGFQHTIYGSIVVPVS